MTHHLSDNGFVYNETCIKCTCTLIYIYIHINNHTYVYIYVYIYIYATPPEPMFQKLRPCLKAYCHVAMIWAKKTAGAVDDTAKMMSSSPKQNDMLFFAMISIQKSTDKVVYDNYPLHLFWALFMWSKATVTRGFCVDFEKWASRLFSWRRWWMTSVQT